MIEIPIGVSLTNDNDAVLWKSQEVLNSHFLCFGESGSGKTFFLRRLITHFATQGIRCYIFDVHSDLDLPEKITSSVKFSEVTAHGINPLLVDPSPDDGGVRRRINTFISLVNHYSQ